MGVVHTVHKCVLTARMAPERSTYIIYAKIHTEFVKEK